MNDRHLLTLRAAALLAAVGLPGVASAQGTAEQQQACTPDAVKLCSDTIPDIPKTTACMKAHFSQLTPRCQAAFADATGGAKPAAPRTKTATRVTTHKAAEHKMAARETPERDAATPEPAERAAPAAVPPDRAALAAVPPETPGYPPFPSPDAPLVRMPAYNPRAQIAQACRAGLIDSFTCQTTVPALLGAGR